MCQKSSYSAPYHLHPPIDLTRHVVKPNATLVVVDVDGDFLGLNGVATRIIPTIPPDLPGQRSVELIALTVLCVYLGHEVRSVLLDLIFQSAHCPGCVDNVRLRLRHALAKRQHGIGCTPCVPSQARGGVGGVGVSLGPESGGL